METATLLLENTLFITPKTNVTFKWHNAQTGLELTTWRRITTGDLEGSWEKAATATFRGEPVEQLANDIARQRENEFPLAPGEGFQLSYDAVNRAMQVRAATRPESFSIPLSALAEFLDQIFKYERQVSATQNTPPSLSEQVRK